MLALLQLLDVLFLPIRSASPNNQHSAFKIRLSDRLIILTTFSIVLLPATQTFGQVPQTSKQRLGVDVVNIDGLRVFGIIGTNDPKKPLTMAIERAWLKQTHPTLFTEVARNEKQRAVEISKTLRTRLEQWIDESKDQENLLEFLVDEQQRLLDNPDNQPADSLFILASFERELVKSVYRQSIENQRIAGLAWQNQIPDVTITSVAKLERALREKSVDIAKATFDLSDQLPPTPESPQNWAARQALIEFARGEPLEFQGTTDNLFRKGDQMDVTKILGSMMSSGNSIERIGRELGLPEFQPQKRTPNKEWWLPAKKAAVNEGKRGVLASRLKQDMLSSDVEVETVFIAKIEDRKWAPIFQYTAVISIDSINTEDVAEITNDPSVQQVLKQFNALGLGQSSQIDRAMKHGAATQLAMKEAKSKFNDFLYSAAKGVDSVLSF